MRGPICYHIIQITVASKHFVFLGQIFLRNQKQKAPFDVVFAGPPLCLWLMSHLHCCLACSSYRINFAIIAR